MMQNNDLISRKGLLLSLPLFNPDQNGYPLNGGIQYARAMIEAAPSMDAAHVVHGRWISWEEAGNYIPSPDRHECSVCHDAAQVLVNGLELLSPYCPNCGAKMDLKDGEIK